MRRPGFFPSRESRHRSPPRPASSRKKMLRKSLLYLSRQPSLFRLVRHNRLAKAMASRFVAGETVESAVAAVRGLNALGITASLDLLGESVTNEGEARAAGAQYV